MRKVFAFLKKVDWGYLALALILGCAGIMLLIYPTDSLTTISYVIGVSTCFVGVLLTIHTLAKTKRGLAFTLTIIGAVLTVVCGLMQLIFPDRMFEVFSSFISLFLIIDASFKIQTVIWAKRLKRPLWWCKLPVCVLVIMGGFLSIQLDDLSPKRIAFLLGVTLFADGLLNLMAFFSPRYAPVVNREAYSIKKSDLPEPSPDKSAPKRSRRAEKRAAKHPNMMPQPDAAPSADVTGDAVDSTTPEATELISPPNLDDTPEI